MVRNSSFTLRNLMFSIIRIRSSSKFFIWAICGGDFLEFKPYLYFSPAVQPFKKKNAFHLIRLTTFSTFSISLYFYIVICITLPKRLWLRVVSMPENIERNIVLCLPCESSIQFVETHKNWTAKCLFKRKVKNPGTISHPCETTKYCACYILWICCSDFCAFPCDSYSLKNH